MIRDSNADLYLQVMLEEKESRSLFRSADVTGWMVHTVSGAIGVGLRETVAVLERFARDCGA